MSNTILKNKINNDNSNKSNNVFSAVTSIRKFSLPSSNLNKLSNNDNVQIYKNRNKYSYFDTYNRKNSNSYTSSENNSSSATGTGITISSGKHRNRNYERIIAAHDYKGRDKREMSMEKGDILIVKQRKGTWIYGIKESNIFKIDLITNQQIKFEHREHGWVPTSYVKPYNKNNV